MTAHDWRLTLRVSHVTAICPDCGATAKGAIHVGSMDLPTSCPGPTPTTHDWTVGADQETAIAACSNCGTFRTSGLADGVGASFGGTYSPSLDLSGECSAVSTVTA
jgi:hypothetical protein